MKTTYTIIISLLCVHLVLGLSGIALSDLFPATTAIVAFNAMAFSIVLAARWRWVDSLLGGADKAYKTHRTLGYTTVIASITHWVTADDVLAGIFPAFTDVANETGEIAVILLLLLALISALKIIPYQLWKKSHSLMGPLFMSLVFHTFFSASPVQVGSVIWWLELAISITAITAWISTVITLRKPHELKIKAIKRLPNAIDITVNKPKPLTFSPGQFANISISSDASKEIHPFTIASAADSDQIRFIIKNAGDYTKHVNQKLDISDSLKLHSIRGGFRINCAVDRNRQIWVAGGVGITPFLAALEQLSLQKNDADNSPTIDFFYAPSLDLGDDIIAQLEDYQQQLNFFNLYFLAKGERLNPNHFTALAAQWQCASLYLCGPDSIKTAAHTFYKQGGGQAKIYSESFDFRAAITLTDVLNYAQKKWPSGIQIPREDLLTLIHSAQKQWIKHANFITRR
jgi:predicted ferric reductase